MKIEQEVYGMKGGKKKFCMEDSVGEYHGKDKDAGSYKE
jgi:hypothetical protein